MANTLAQHLRSRISKVCAAIIGNSPEEMLERAAAALKETSFLEFRLDYLGEELLSPEAAFASLKQFMAEHTEATVIATCRLEKNGGRFRGTVEGEFELLMQAAAAGFHLVDVELESAEADSKGKSGQMERLRATGVGLIVSFHDFERTGDPDDVYRRMQPFRPEFVKIVTTAQTLSDNVTLMRFIERISDQASIVGVCMGEAGIISRVLGLRAGSAFTFAAASAGEETAPGQIAARTLIETYRIEDVDISTKVYGVAGNPIGKSLSPVMMNTAFRRETVNAVYLALQTAEIEDLVSLVREIPIQGLSITMPHKQAILPYLEHMDPLSAKIGACNTVLRQGGKLYGFNTDVQGILTPLQKRITLKDCKVLVLGAGGAARAAVFALRDKGAEVSILNRTPETAAKLAKQAGAKVVKREALAKLSFDVVLNATPVGMAGQGEAPPVNPGELKAKLVFDLVYNPVDTPLLKLARSQGIAVITGVEMFVQQGARQFEIWTGKPAPEDEMLKVVIHALRQQAEAAGEPRPSDHIPASVSHPQPAESETDEDEELEDTEREPEPTPVKAVSRKTSKGTEAAPAPVKDVPEAKKPLVAQAAPAKSPGVKAVVVKDVPAKDVPEKSAAARAIPAAAPRAEAKKPDASSAGGAKSAGRAAPAKASPPQRAVAGKTSQQPAKAVKKAAAKKKR